MSHTEPGGHEDQEKPREVTKDDAHPDDVTERPEVKSLIEKAGAGKVGKPAHGTVVTGGSTAGGGSTKPHDLDTPHKPRTVKPEADDPS